jgi:hypothetical protein
MNRASVVADLNRRLDALGTGPLTQEERDELAELEADHERRFPGLLRGGPQAVYDLTDDQLEDYLRHETGHDGVAQRHYQLRQRARSPEEVERDRIQGERIAAMSEEELERWVCAQLRKPPWLTPDNS